MKRLLGFFICFTCLKVYAYDYKAAFVADIDTGRVLIAENDRVQNYPASLTKIMTLYLTFDALEHDRLHLDDLLIVSESAAAANPIKLGIRAGTKISVEDAIKAVAVVSANDVARVLAENLRGGKEGNFASLMTQVANEIGLKETNFENSSGLPDDEHMSSARDIALLSMAIYKHFPQYWKYFSIKSWTFDGKTYTNGNRLLVSYPGCDGMKTGFTNKSKYSLVSTAKRNNIHLISVVLGAESKDARAAISTQMLNRGFEILDKTIQPVTINTTVQASQKTIPVQSIAKSGAGVQFGAFGSMESAKQQQAKIEQIFNVHADISNAPNGMFRVRVNNLSIEQANQLSAMAFDKKLENYVFH